ncbi:hypothetical protein FisN_1Lh043 [Fistulifera solaris]|uniref:Uncharacterized protein n=1 Tax=Fistulifera solaris TaxID=1519565 RepID=A0A1Z5JC50_FISSO|nr:hypothetical protein FisN_1Lh043 [Fistulifera solaris]|eukprot:GAX11594.1 hypothetical protein FisN_1Lh043 [Fistulifera solaris]
MTSICEQLRNNDYELRELRLTESPEAYAASMSDLIEALSSNTVVDYIRLDRDFLPCMDENYMEDFFSTIGALPALTEAHIWHASVPVKVLADFLKNANKIEFLEFGCLDLQGSAEDFAIISKAIENHPTLTGFNLTDFCLNDDSIVMDDFIKALSTIPNLEKVKIEVTRRRRVSLVGSVAASQPVKVIVRGLALASLISAPKMNELTLNRLALDLDDFEALAEAIKTAPSIKGLALPHCGLNDESADHIAKAIGLNQSLEKLDLSCNSLTDEGCIVIATALADNRSIKMLRLWGNVKISNAGFDALAEMLQKNVALERIPLMAPAAYKNKIDADNMKTRAGISHAA